MKLVTPRLRLRPLQPSDINATYLGWLNDPEVTRFSNQRFREHTAESCEAYLASFGHVVEPDDIKRIRPGMGLAPKYFDQLIGQRLVVSVTRGTKTEWNLFEKS